MMELRVKRWAVTAALAAVLAVPAGAAGPPWNEAQARTLFEWLAPPKAERRWEEIPWRLTLRDGIADAAAQDRPMLVWLSGGHPLGVSEARTTMARRSLFETDEVIRMALERFVPVAESTDGWQLEMARVGELRGFLERCGFQDAPAAMEVWGRPELGRRMGGTDGLYCVASSGEPLACMDDPRKPQALRTMLEQAERRYAALAPAARLPRVRAVPRSPWRWSRFLPRSAIRDGTIVLEGIVRDVAWDYPLDDACKLHSEKPRGWYTHYGNRKNWNVDRIWLPAAAELVPANPKAGEVFPLPERVARLLARFHFIDSVHEAGMPFGAADVKRFDLSAEVVGVTSAAVEMRLRGETRCVAEGVWQAAARVAPELQERGVSVWIEGWLSYDRARRRFTRFDLLAAGTRWGASPGNRRVDVERAPFTENRAPARIGFAFRLSPSGPADSLPPAALGRLGALYFAPP